MTDTDTDNDTGPAPPTEEAVMTASDPHRARGRAATASLLALATVALVLVAGEALGCPTCKDGVAESDPEGMNLARGYFYSILIMMAMPFTLAGTFGAYVWREMRRQELGRAAANLHDAPGAAGESAGGVAGHG